ncbi:hypothetical protein K438DRAFT_1756858 [Mycena galopus ATCC 62051]|nr:hypothetical protein K438DRAFT_1756858 [Mycena galopus ATCC 62051]
MKLYYRENSLASRGSSPKSESLNARNNVQSIQGLRKNVAQFIRPGLAIATKYYKKFDDTDAYIIAMYINPSIRFEWIKQNWTAQDQQISKLESYEADTNEVEHSGQSTPESMTLGSPMILALDPVLEGRLQWPHRTSSSGPALSTYRSGGGNQSIEEEMKHYERSVIPPRRSMDLVGYWAGLIKTLLAQPSIGSGLIMLAVITALWSLIRPCHIYRLFIDYAAAQATSVPSERVFSSSAETDTKHCNRINPILMEALQMLKFNYKKSHLNFMSEGQSATVADDDKDWLQVLASTTNDKEKQEIRREISDSCDFADIVYFEMPEEQSN